MNKLGNPVYVANSIYKVDDLSEEGEAELEKISKEIQSVLRTKKPIPKLNLPKNGKYSCKFEKNKKFSLDNKTMYSRDFIPSFRHISPARKFAPVMPVRGFRSQGLGMGLNSARYSLAPLASLPKKKSKSKSRGKKSRGKKSKAKKSKGKKRSHHKKHHGMMMF